MKAAVIQYELKPGHLAYNHAKAEELLKQAALGGAELVVLPELWNVGYALEQLEQLAQNSQGESLKLLKKIAKQDRLFIMGGSIAERRDGKYYNTAFAIDQNGQLVGKYRKTHLFPLGLKEGEYFTVGDDWGLIDTPWEKAGMILCYDIRFPELMRNLALRGARIITIGAEFPAARVDHWRLFCQARAIENQVFVLAANCCGNDGKYDYPGNSMIISPTGKILQEAGEIVVFL